MGCAFDREGISEDSQAVRELPKAKGRAIQLKSDLHTWCSGSLLAQVPKTSSLAHRSSNI